jgi:lipid II:glycine glycyltransferase (peptidoglycan interpeptide bridge formation enzyme)
MVGICSKAKINLEKYETRIDSFKIEVNRLGQIEWDQVCSLFSDATIYQTWAYGAVRWGTNNLQHVIVKEDESIIAAAQVIEKRIFNLNYGIAYLPWGPMFRLKNGNNELHGYLAILNFIKENYIIRHKMFLIINPNIWHMADSDNKAIINAGFIKLPEKAEYRTIVLDLKRSIEELRKNFKQKWRNCLNQSHKNGLDVSCDSSDESFKEFLYLQEEMRQRKGFKPAVDYNEFLEINRLSNQDFKFKIFLCKHNNQVNSALVLSIIGDTAIYLLGASNQDGRRLKSAYFLQWTAMNYIKNAGIGFYDLGGVDKLNNKSVYDFKAGINGNEYFHIGSFYCCDSKISSLIYLGAKLSKRFH